MIHVWVEHLNVLKLLWLLLRYSMQDIVLFYCSATTLSQSIIDFLCKLNLKSIHIRREDVQLGVQDKNGRALRYYVEHQTSFLASTLFQEKRKQTDWLPAEYEKYSDEWIRILKSHCMMSFKKTLVYICGVEHKYSNNEIKTEGVKKVVIYVNHSVMGSHIRDSYKFTDRFPFEMKLFFHWRYNLLYFPVPGIIASVLLRTFVSSIKSKPLSKMAPVAAEKGCIWEEYFTNIFSTYPGAGQLYWFTKNVLDGERVVLYCDRNDSPCDEKARVEIESRGFGWIDFSYPWRNVRHPVKLTLKCMINCLKAFPKSWSEFDVWRWTSLISFSALLECYRAIYRTNKVRAIHQHQEWGPATILKALALRMEDGIMIWNHWSVDHYPVAYFDCGLADLVLSWGQLNDGYFNAHDFSYKYLIQTGMIAGDGFDASVLRKANETRALFSHSVNFVISLFDSSHSSKMENATATMLYFYKNILAAILLRRGWGVVVKPKGPHFDRLPKKEAVHGVIKELVKQGRCILMNGDEKVSVAAYVGDVSVCYSINSAGILAALCGKQVLHFDLSGCLEHPLSYLGGEDTVVFRSFEKLLHALEAIEKGNGFYGDHSERLHLFDAFQDGRGSERAGEVIGAYIRYRDNGMDRESALKKAVADYAVKWGDDKVSIPGAVQNHLGNDLWTRVMKNVSGDIDDK